MKLAFETRYSTLYEIENGRDGIDHFVSRPTTIEEFLRLQERFSYLLRPENAPLLEELKMVSRPLGETGQAGGLVRGLWSSSVCGQSRPQRFEM
ncbi:MAG: hypothetical protein NZ988_06280 [Thaumarchaeota archaeon]|nr:hypothetical protein [Candidatus Calditenuaceae archaeon]MDW8187630.1 hypothetical protein [Nitrososphaerota archaeon]